MKNEKLPYDKSLTHKERIEAHFEHNSKYSAQDLIDLGQDESKLLKKYKVVEQVEENVELGTGTAFPNAESEQDNADILVRYKYDGNLAPERSFCKQMMAANKVYRKEDIVRMGDNPVNPGFGLNGSNTYSIWDWKGGGMMSTAFPQGTCKHRWKKVIYEATEDSSISGTPMNTTQAKAKGYDVPINDSKVGRKPHNM